MTHHPGYSGFAPVEFLLPIVKSSFTKGLTKEEEITFFSIFLDELIIFCIPIFIHFVDSFSLTDRNMRLFSSIKHFLLTSRIEFQIFCLFNPKIFNFQNSITILRIMMTWTMGGTVPMDTQEHIRDHIPLFMRMKE